MTTPPRQFHAGYWYHVYTRSLEEIPLFYNDKEKLWFIKKLDKVFTREKLGLGALCLMNTDYHALVKMGPINLDRALNSLHTSYALHLNPKRGRRGKVFEPSPGVDIILNDSYLLQLVPYIHKNPVKAKLVDDPRKYPWHTDQLYRVGRWQHGQLSSWEWPPYFRGKKRCAIYRNRMGENVELARQNEGYIGQEEEWLRLEKRNAERKERYRERRNQRPIDEIVNELAKAKGVSVKSLKKPGRKAPEVQIRQEAMVRLHEEGYGPTEIGEYFGRSKGTVSYTLKKFNKK